MSGGEIKQNKKQKTPKEEEQEVGPFIYGEQYIR